MELSALEKLRRQVTGDGPKTLADVAKAATGHPWLLLDVSSSMHDSVRGWGDDDMHGKHVSKIDQLREVVGDLGSHFHERQITFGQMIEIRDDVPDPSGFTPMAEAIEFAIQEGAECLIIVSDGQPDNPDGATAQAKLVSGQIDTFYVGPAGGSGEQFLQSLSNLSGGSHGVTDLTDPRQLTEGIKGLLPAKGETTVIAL